ncbi:protein SPMIP1-like [Diretmus argenteus]
MRTLMTTQNQNFYREQIQKEMLTRLAWKTRYSKLYPSCFKPRNKTAVLPPVTTASERQKHLPPPLPPAVPAGGEGGLSVAPLMRPVSPQTREALYQASSHHGKGRSLYLQRRGQKRPEEKFDFPLLSSWEYGWRLGDYSLDYRSPASGRSSVVKNTFYARNGIFNNPSATDTLLG